MEILSYLQSGVSAVIPFVILLGLLIFVHELGHFAVAKFFGVRVEIFSLGFGKKLLKYKHGDTLYCICLIPLGGYVKMYGDEPGGEVPEDQKKYSFTHKPVGQRIAVVLAGPLMNLFFAVFVFFAVALIGEDMRSPKIGDVPVSSVAHQFGFRSGDKVLSVNSESVKTWEDFQHLISQSSDKDLNVSVQREGSDLVSEFSIRPELKPNPNILSLDDYVGVIDGLSIESRLPIVGVRSNSLASSSGLKTGDLIKKINGQEIQFFRQIENSLIALQNQEIQIEVERYLDLESEKTEAQSITLKLKNFASLASIGIESSEMYLARIAEDSPAQKAGLKPGDRIVAINSTEPQKWEDILNSVKNFSGEGAISIDVERAGETINFQIAPQITSHMNNQGGEEKRYTVGIVPWIINSNGEFIKVQSDNIWAATIRGVERSYEVTVMTVVSFLRLIQNKISPKNIGGPIAIGQAAKKTFEIGLSQFLTMMGLISINLFIINLLPIPVLDGGHLLFYSIEALKGAPLSMRKMEIAQQFGLVVLMSLMAFALFNDFSRLLGFW